MIVYKYVMNMWLRINTLLLLLGLLIPNFYFSQSDLNYDQQLVFTQLNNKDFESAKKTIDSKFLKSDNDSRKIIGYAYLVRCYPDINDGGKKKEALENVKKIADKGRKTIDNAYVAYAYAYYYSILGKNKLFLESVYKSINIFSRHIGENFVLSELYELMFSYKKSKLLRIDGQDNIKENIYALRSKNKILIANSYCSIGNRYANLYQKTNNKKYLEASIIAFRNAHHYAELINDLISKKKALISYYLNYGSLVQEVIEPGNENKILSIYNKGLEIGENDNIYYDDVILIYANIATEYERNNKIKQAEKYYHKAYQIIKKTNADIVPYNKRYILSNLSRIYEKFNQPGEALKYEKEVLKLIDNDFYNQIVNHSEVIENFYQGEKNRKKIDELVNEKENYNKQQILYLAFIVLIITCIVFLIYTLHYRQKLNKQRTNLLETEKHEAELTLKLEIEEKSRLKADQELLIIQQEQLQRQTLAASLQLNKKTAFINELKDKIKDQKDFSIERILKEEQIADHNFDDIQNIIQEVHPGFFKHLNEISKAKLTNQDMRYAAYIYLNMNNHQISSVLKADPKAVRMAKYRLKKKLELGKEQDLYVFIQSLKL